MKSQNIYGLIIIATIAFFSLYRLGDSFFNADQHFWYTRTQKFMNAVLEQDWKDTYQNPKPGVTVMWLSGIGMESFLWIYQKIYNFRPQLYTYDTFPYFEWAVKLPLLTVIFSLYYYSFKLLEKLTQTKTALLTIALLVYQPFFLGITRTFHGDGTLTAFMTASVITTFYYIKHKDIKHLLIASLLAGLAFLAKMQAFYLLAYIPLVLGINCLKEKKLLTTIKEIFIFFLATLITIFIFFPALWVKPAKVINNMVFEAQVVTEEGRNGGDGSVYLYLAEIPKIFTPWNLFFFIFGVFTLRKVIKTKEFTNIYVLSFLFILFYSIQSAIIFQKSSRYLLPLFPFISLIATQGVEYLLNKQKYFNYNQIAWAILIMGIGTLGYWAPHYTAQNEEQPWGAVYAEAANYLNQKPNATELKVIATPKEHTFRPFFKGKTFSKYEKLPNNWTPDYLVINKTGKVPEKYDYCKFEKDINFRNKTFWKIYNCEES